VDCCLAPKGTSIALLETELAVQVSHVETFNSALRLYKRLGFRIVGESGIYLEMIWKPA
jgi:ribosomal protein S18 acetylase RimI-like enzyme